MTTTTSPTTVENFAGDVFALPIRVERDPAQPRRWALLDANGARVDDGFRIRAEARVLTLTQVRALGVPEGQLTFAWYVVRGLYVYGCDSRDDARRVAASWNRSEKTRV